MEQESLTRQIAATRAYDWVRHHADRRPTSIALIEAEDTSRRLSYAELDEGVDGWVRRLAALGVRRGDVVALLAQNSTVFLEVLLACGRSGVALLPLNWRLTISELTYIVGDSGARLLLHDDECADLASGLVEVVGATAALSAPDPGGEAPAPVDVHLDDLAVVMYTSGTTGRPKGAMITHGMTFWHAVNISPPARIDPTTVHLCMLPFFHTGGLNLYVNPVLHAGGTVVVARKFDVDLALDLLTDADVGITHFFGVPTVYQAISESPRFAAADLSHLRMAGVGGAAASAPLLRTWAAKGVPLAQGWGMTEGGPSGTVVDVDDPATPVGSVGKPLLHFEIRVVDPGGRDVPAGEVGELWIKGPSVTPGYWRNPVATGQAFHEGWFRTGDAVRRDEDGYVFIVDRWKDMFISGGENVYPAEVEAVILELPEVANVAVVGFPDAHWGEVGAAFIVPTPGATLTDVDVLEHCRTYLARFKVPRRVEFVDQLPMTASGKIRKRELQTSATND